MLHCEVWTIHYLAILLQSRIQDLSRLRVFHKIDATVAPSQSFHCSEFHCSEFPKRREGFDVLPPDFGTEHYEVS